MYIYKTTNTLNNKVYIGKSTKPYNENYLGSGKLLIKAVKKYGVKNFFVEVIDTADNLKDLNDKEKYWILLYKNNSYNIAEGGTGGDTMSNHPNKKEHYKKIGEKVSKKLTGHLVSDSSKLKQSKSHTGWFNRLTEIEKNEYRDKISKKMKELYKNGHHSKGKKLSDDHKNKLSIAAKKNKFGGDTFSTFSLEKKNIIRKKITKSLLGRVVSNETREKIRKSLLGHIVTEETKLKIRESLLKNKGSV